VAHQIGAFRVHGAMTLFVDTLKGGGSSRCLKYLVMKKGEVSSQFLESGIWVFPGRLLLIRTCRTSEVLNGEISVDVMRKTVFEGVDYRGTGSL